jgi:Nucleotidyltransferase domain.
LPANPQTHIFTAPTAAERKMDMSIEQSTLDELVKGILETIGGTVSAIILYGSVARGTADRDSDVDVALIINRPLSATDDDKLTDFIVDMNLKYGKLFSVIDIQDDDYKKWQEIVPFYKNVAKEGVVLWKAA